MRYTHLTFLIFTLVMLGIVGCNPTQRDLPTVADQINSVDSTLNQPTEDQEFAETQETFVEETPNYCLTCHVDQQQLIDTAKPEEVVESESSGEG